MEYEKEDCAVHTVREQLITLWYGASFEEDKRILARCASVFTSICYGIEKRNTPTDLLKNDNKNDESRINTSINDSELYIKELKSILNILEKNSSNLCSTAFSLINHFLSINKELLLFHVKDKICPAGICFKNPWPPCQKACPAGIDIPGFMAEVGKENYKEAISIITEVNPFPYVCGMICPAPCESVCLRQAFDEPVFIRTMKAAAAKAAIEQQGGYPEPAGKILSGKNIAVIGSGPAGLSAAFFLAKQGHSPVVFESEKNPGGMLRYGIPDFRLPVDILEKDIAWIESSGVEIRTNQRVEGITKLFNDGFDAIFIAAGIPVSRKIPFHGNDLPHVISGIDFLRKINKKENPKIGSDVVVIGGGNVAVDVAMAALRQGAGKVHMVCLENMDEMPASSHELKTATDEGVLIHNSWGPFRATEDKIFEAVFCKRVFDENGRFSPEFDNEKRIKLYADNILIAAGQTSDLSFLEEQSGIKTDGGLISVRKNSCETDREGVFAGGDLVSGPGIAVEAIKSGRLAAMEIDIWLKKNLRNIVKEKSINSQLKHDFINSRIDNVKYAETTGYVKYEDSGESEKNQGNVKYPEIAKDEKYAEIVDNYRGKNCNGRDFISHLSPPIKVSAIHRGETKRAVLKEKEPEKRKNNYLPFESELDPEMAVREAGRCLRCDLCIGCGMCQFICSEMGVNAIRLAKTDDDRFIFVDFTTTMSDKCISCGACAEVCPTGAIKIIRQNISYGINKGIVRKTEFTGTDMCEQPVLECEQCGKPLMTERYYKFIEKRILKHQSSDQDSLRLCQACTRLKIAEKTEKFKGTKKGFIGVDFVI